MPQESNQESLQNLLTAKGLANDGSKLNVDNYLKIKSLPSASNDATQLAQTAPVERLPRAKEIREGKLRILTLKQVGENQQVNHTFTLDSPADPDTSMPTGRLKSGNLFRNKTETGVNSLIDIHSAENTIRESNLVVTKDFVKMNQNVTITLRKKKI